jgi:hypothetical protein
MVSLTFAKSLLRHGEDSGCWRDSGGRSTVEAIERRMGSVKVGVRKSPAARDWLRDGKRAMCVSIR